MLQKIGDSLKGKKTVAYVILVPLVLVFAVWGAAGMVNLDFFSGAGWAAKVDGAEIPLERVNDAWREQQSQWQQRFGTEIPEAERVTLQDGLLEQAIRETLIQERTRDARLSGRQLARSRSTSATSRPSRLDGKYNEQPRRWRAWRRSACPPMPSAPRSAPTCRTPSCSARCRSPTSARPLEVERAFRIEDEQREVRYALLPQEKFAAAVMVDDAAVQAYYARNQARYQTAETVRLQYAELRLEQIAAQVTVAEADLQDLYAKNRDRYVDPEKRRPSHILVSIEAGKEAEALKQAEAIAAEARQPGADFAALAKKYSKDAGSAAQGGDLGWSERSAFVGPFSDAVFAMKEGELRGPVKTEFGYHVIRLDGIQPSHVEDLRRGAAGARVGVPARPRGRPVRRARGAGAAQARGAERGSRADRRRTSASPPARWPSSVAAPAARRSAATRP